MGLSRAALKLVPAHAPGDMRELVAKHGEGALFLIEYRDGFNAAVFMPNGWVHEGDGGAFIFAGRLKGQAKPVACQYYLQQPDPFGHFAHLLRAIERLARRSTHSSHAARTSRRYSSCFSASAHGSMRSLIER